MANAALHALLTKACDPADAVGRERAFQELLRLLAIYVRGAMGTALRDHRESMDVCQSIARSFVEDFAGGKVRFENEQALAGYLQQVVRSKLAALARHDGAAKRGGGAGAVPIGISDSGGSGFIPPAADHTASTSARDREAARRVVDSLTEEEQTLVRLRRTGLEWDHIARELGKDPAALRQQYSRLQRRISDEIGGESQG
jgi:DNA-directed RNA polymerase specialized sigma24 family protein